MTNFLTDLAASGAFEWLFALAAVKASLLLAVAALTGVLFRRLPAATRHLLWASALCAALLMPLLSFGAVWEIPVLPVAADEPAIAASYRLREATAGETTAVSPAADGREETERPAAASLVETERGPAPATAAEESASVLSRLAGRAWLIWLCGALLIFFRLLLGLAATNFLARRAAPFEDAAINELFAELVIGLELKRSVRLLRSERAAMPVVCGLFRSAVLLPAGAEIWPAERQRLVLLHELTHVARRDCLTQMLAQLACAVYWFNPFVWLAERRLRIERERACDDYVLSVGARPSEYAQHLLEIARGLRHRAAFDWSDTATVAVARRSQLEGRVRAILDRDAARRAASRRATLGIVSLVALALLALALVHPAPIDARRSPMAGNFADLDHAPADVEALESFGSSAVTIATKSVNAPPANEFPEALKKTSAGDDTPKGAEAGPATAADAEPSSAPENAGQTAAPEMVPDAASPENAPKNASAPASFIDVQIKWDRGPSGAGAPTDYIDELASVGYANLTVNELVKLKQAGVTAEYVRSLRAIGIDNLSVRDLASMSLHGVSPAYVQSIRGAGYAELTTRELINFRIHGVTPEFIKSLRTAGYDALTPRLLADFAVHRVTPDYIAALRSVGFERLAPRELVNLRVYDVKPDFIRRARAQHGELTVRQIIALKNSGALDGNREQ